MRLRKKRSDNHNPIQVTPEKKERPRLRKVMVWVACGLLLALIGVMVFASLFPNTAALQVPGTLVADAVTPVQNVFSAATNAVVSYLRALKYRGNIEYEYSRVVEENKQLYYLAMRVGELERQLSDFANLRDEIVTNEDMMPLFCSVIGKDSGNYFSVFTINKGAKDGVEDYMAVVAEGALIGYTYNVTENRSMVRAIIDGQASIHGLIQSNRDQGMVKGTLSEDGTPMCRMYYLPNTLPRPGDLVVTSGLGMPFPKGIPIGTVRESTRNMDANKQYIVVEPKADFERIEYVTVLRYKPEAQAVERREQASSINALVPLDSPRPYLDLFMGDQQIHVGPPTPSPNPDATPGPESSPAPGATAPPMSQSPGGILEYQVPGSREDSTPLPPTPSPSPSPTPGFSMDDLTMEGDE